jgi:hypothetical protein
MSTLSKIALSAGLAILTGATLAGPKSKPLLVATITNTGSTNTSGSKIDVYSSGTASCQPIYRRRPIMAIATTDRLPRRMFIKLMHDLNAAMPLSSLPVRHGMRSVSFGTRTYITYKGQSSPDLTFGGNAQVKALLDDIIAIRRLEMHGDSEPFYSLPPIKAPVH